jgi:hypothetical protein
MVAIRGLARRKRRHGENQTKVNLIWTEFGRSQDINLISIDKILVLSIFRTQSI